MNKKNQINRLMKNKTPFAFVIKIIILIGAGYFLIQLSNKAKNIEEAQYLPDMQNTLDYAEHYITWRYGGDWGKLGHRFNHDGLYSLDLETDIRRLKIVRGGQSEFLFYAWFNSTQEEIDNGHSIRGLYEKEALCTVVFSEGEEYVLYEIMYKDGECIPNFEMEQRFSITTDEIRENIEQIYIIFESELQKMHEYQIGKVRKRRKNLANLGFILFAIYMFYKWRFIMAEAADGDKPTEQYLGETIVNTINKLARWKYVLCGATILFWIYILRPVISNFILFGVENSVNIYVSYGISAMIVAIAGCFVIVRNGAEKPENTRKKIGSWQIVQMTAGCILEMFIIRLGMMLVSDLYPYSLRFYIINGIAWIGAVVLMFVLRKVKHGPGYESRSGGGTTGYSE